MTTPDKLDLAKMREDADATNDDDRIELLDRVEQLLALPTPYRQGTNEEYKSGFDHGFNEFRRQARKLFGVEEA